MHDHLFFFVGLAFILTHEMDAIKRREWAILPFLSRLDDRTGFIVFTALHVPLYLILFVALVRPEGLNRTLIRGLDLFLVIHALLHVFYLRHPRNEFTSLLSWIFIGGAAAAGLVDWILTA